MIPGLHWGHLFFSFLTGNREFKEGESSKQDFCVSLIVCRFFDGRELGKPFSNICQLAASIPVSHHRVSTFLGRDILPNKLTRKFRTVLWQVQ